MEIINSFFNLFFFAGIIYVIHILFILGQKMLDFFVLKNEKTVFVLTTNEKIILWLSMSFILNKIFL
jgi:hypothetical protein